MYHIAKFLENQSVEVVPNNWLNDKKDICFWPPYKSISKMAVSLEESEAVSCDWEQRKVRILRSFDTYNMAVKKLLEWEHISGLAAVSTESEKKRKHCKRCKFSCSSDSEDEPVCIPSTSNSSQHLFREANLIALTDNEKSTCQNLTSMKEVKVEDSRTDDGRAAHIIYYTGDLSNSLVKETESSNASRQLEYSSENNASFNCPCNHYTLQVLMDLKKLVESQNVLLQRVINDKNADGYFPNTLPGTLPYNTVEELKILEEFLRNEDQFNSASLYLATLGGFTLKLVVKNILKKLIGHELSLIFNWSGKGARLSFRELTKINELIYRTVVKSSHCRGTTLAEVEKEIKIWLKYAADRNGGRSKR